MRKMEIDQELEFFNTIKDLDHTIWQEAVISSPEFSLDRLIEVVKKRYESKYQAYLETLDYPIRASLFTLISKKKFIDYINERFPGLLSVRPITIYTAIVNIDYMSAKRKEKDEC